MSTRKTLALLLAVGMVLALGGAARAGLLVDLDGQGGPTQGGYTSWDPPHSDGSETRNWNCRG